MEESELERSLRAIRLVESADLSELESTAYRLDMTSLAFTNYLGAYRHVVKGTAREYYLDKLGHGYSTAFGGFIQAVARDTQMADEERWTAIKTVMASEDAKRMEAIVAVIENRDITLMRADGEDIDWVLEAPRRFEKFTDAADAVTDTFTDLVAVDIRLFKGLVDWTGQDRRQDRP